MAGRARKTRTKTAAAPVDTASLYLRLSRESRDESTGLATQEADLRALAKRLGLSVVAVHVDDGESGALRKRPGLQKWLADGREARADHLLAWHLSRVTRGGIAALPVLLDTIDGKDSDGKRAYPPVRFLSVSDQLDSDAPDWDLRVGLGAVMAKTERDAMVERTRRSVEQRQAEGRWIGGPLPYGTRAVPNPDGSGKVLAVDEREAEKLREALRRLQTGDSPASVARWMTAHGPKPRRASEWHRNTLLQALSSDAASRLVFSATERRAIQRIVEPVEPRGYYERKPMRLLSGLLRCAGCGRPLTLFQRTQHGKRYIAYRCQTRGRGGICTGAIAINADLVDDGVTERWLEGWGPLAEQIVVRAVDAVAEELAALEEDVDEAGRAVVAARGADRAAALKHLERLERKRDRLAARPLKALAYLRDTGRTYAEVWSEASLEERHNLLRDTVGHLTIGPGRKGAKGFQEDRVVDLWRLDPGSPEWEATG